MPQTYIPLTSRQAEEDAFSIDDGFTPHQPKLAPRGFHAKNRRHLIYGLAAVAALVLIFAFSAPHTIMWPQWRKGSNSTAPLSGCGSSPETAAQAGCQFDLMAFAWSQPACFDQELTEEFLALREWKWWSDAGGAQEVAREDVALGAHEELFVSWDYQLQQCVYLWNKMQRAVVSKTSLDSYTLDPERTKQCGDMLLDQNRPAAETNTLIVMKYTTCGIEQ
ncbi:unnamed protein product [Discula destructiva]